MYNMQLCIVQSKERPWKDWFNRKDSASAWSNRKEDVASKRSNRKDDASERSNRKDNASSKRAISALATTQASLQPSPC
jgi:hypothetical protein